MHEDWVRALEVTDDGALMASAGHDKVTITTQQISIHELFEIFTIYFLQTVRVWDLSKLEVLHVMREHTHYVECLAFSPATLTSFDGPDVHCASELADRVRERLTRAKTVLETSWLLAHETRQLRYGRQLLAFVLQLWYKVPFPCP